MEKFKYKGYIVFTEILAYHGGNPAIDLMDASTDELVACATVNVPGLSDIEVVIKDYSENTGMYDCLLANDIIHPAHRHVSSGMVESIPVCRLITK